MADRRIDSRGRVSRVARRATQLLAVLILVVIVSMGSSVLQAGTGARQDGGSAVVISLARWQPAARGNCPDARTIAARAALLNVVIGPSTTILRLTPVAGCAANGPTVRAFRTRVRMASLMLEPVAADWFAADAVLHHQLVRAHVRSLHELYPRARIVVIVAVSGRIVWRSAT